MPSDTAAGGRLQIANETPAARMTAPAAAKMTGRKAARRAVGGAAVTTVGPACTGAGGGKAGEPWRAARSANSAPKVNCKYGVSERILLPSRMRKPPVGGALPFDLINRKTSDDFRK